MLGQSRRHGVPSVCPRRPRLELRQQDHFHELHCPFFAWHRLQIQASDHRDRDCHSNHHHEDKYEVDDDCEDDEDEVEDDDEDNDDDD